MANGGVRLLTALKRRISYLLLGAISIDPTRFASSIPCVLLVLESILEDYIQSPGGTTAYMATSCNQDLAHDHIPLDLRAVAHRS